MAQLQTRWEPHSGQTDVIQSDARIRVVAAGRQWGKTTLAADRIAAYSTENDGSECRWVAPTEDKAKEGLTAVCRRLSSKDILETSRKYLSLRNGSEIQFHGAERLRRDYFEECDMVVADEAAHFTRSNILPAFTTAVNTDDVDELLIVSTPNGDGWFCDYHQRGISNDSSNDHIESWRFTSESAPHISSEYIEDVRECVSERTFREEYLSEFIVARG